MKCIFSRQLNREHSQHLLNLITSFLTERSDSAYQQRESTLIQTLTKQSKLGKLLIYQTRRCKLTERCFSEKHKFKMDYWECTYFADFFYNVVRPLKLVCKIGTMSKDTRRDLKWFIARKHATDFRLKMLY